MIINLNLPSKMSPQLRLSEIGAIMARGYIRLKNSQKELDVMGNAEPPCDTTVNSNGAVQSVEVT